MFWQIKNLNFQVKLCPQDVAETKKLTLLSTKYYRPDQIKVKSIHKRMVQFQKLIRNLFLTLHGHNVHHQQRQLSKFLMRYQQFASHA